MMIDILEISTNLMTVTLYSILVSALIFGFSRLISHYNSSVLYWRDYWLLLSAMCFLPVFYSFIPENSFNLNLFESHNLAFQENHSAVIVPLKALAESNSTTIQMDWFDYLAIAWSLIIALGIIYHLLRFFVRLKKVHVIISNSLKLNDAKDKITDYQYKLFEGIQKKIKVDILLTDLSISPFVFQWSRKKLILPTAIFHELTAQEINLILRHELVHIKNHDSLVVLFSYLMQSILWFNPFLRFFQEKMIWALEVNCDYTVLIKKPKLRKIYAQLMLKMFSQSTSNDDRLMVLSFSLKTKHSITQRINNIILPSYQQIDFHYYKSKLLGALLVFFIITFFFQPKLNASTSNSPLIMMNPVLKAKFSFPFGYDEKHKKLHNGVDLKAQSKTPIVATADGIIRISKRKKRADDYEELIIIEHSDNLQTVYAHLNTYSITAGQRVKAGQLIGYIGNSAGTTKALLHLEILKNNEPIDPKEYITFSN